MKLKIFATFCFQDKKRYLFEKPVKSCFISSWKGENSFYIRWVEKSKRQSDRTERIIYTSLYMQKNALKKV